MLGPAGRRRVGDDVAEKKGQVDLDALRKRTGCMLWSSVFNLGFHAHLLHEFLEKADEATLARVRLLEEKLVETMVINSDDTERKSIKKWSGLLEVEQRSW